jgi:hypothetical protein
MYSILSDETLALLERRSRRLYDESERAIIGNFGGAAFGDIALVQGLTVAHPHGIRAVADWYMAALLYPDYVRGIFERQLEIALRNLELYRQAVGDRIVAVFVSGTDFGSQTGAFISPKVLPRDVPALPSRHQ